ncbi:MAG: hypothetical protein M5U22_14095 [Thermoleophilia bacterium]|nr:hypothetical protein [Thermoleophilia bacterium]
MSLWLDLGGQGRGKVILGQKEDGNCHITRGLPWTPRSPLPMSLSVSIFEESRRVILAVALGGHPESANWDKIDWVWEQEYEAEMTAEGPRLVEVGKV